MRSRWGAVPADPAQSPATALLGKVLTQSCRRKQHRTGDRRPTTELGSGEKAQV